MLSLDPGVIVAAQLFGIDGVTVTLEWNSIYSYNVTAVPYLLFNLAPDGNMTRVQFKVPYNTLYNISVLATPPCGQNIMTSFFEFYYAKCEDPASQIDSSLVSVLEYRNPAIEGSDVILTCAPGLVLTGPNMSTCMGNGEWEPNPGEVKCLAHCNVPFPPPNGHILPYTSTLEGAKLTFACWNVNQRGHQYQCEEINVTAVCNDQGHWEPNTDDICAEPTGALLCQDGIIAVASSVSTFTVSSIVFFTFGYLCRHYRQKREQTLPTPVYEDVLLKRNTEQALELKENIAYGPLATCS